MKVLITGGGSEEPIDNVRSVCNFSTGRTASFLADFFADSGFEVTCLMAEKAVKPSRSTTRVLTYKTFAQLKSALEEECRTGHYNAIIHAAAVSDYSPETIQVDGKSYKAGEVSKVPAGTELVIRMKKNPKLVDSLKKNAGKDCTIVAFKLTSNATVPERQAAVNKIFSANSEKSLVPDLVVSNDLSEITATAHPCTLYKNNMTVAGTVQNLKELADFLCKYIKGGVIKITSV